MCVEHSDGGVTNKSMSVVCMRLHTYAQVCSTRVSLYGVGGGVVSCGTLPCPALPCPVLCYAVVWCGALPVERIK